MTDCLAEFQHVRCLWRSDDAHDEHRAWLRRDGGLYSVYWTDDGTTRERRVQSIVTRDGSWTYVDPAGRTN